MKVQISDIMNEHTLYWYKAKEIYEVKEDTAISYRVAKGEHKGKMIYHGHCKILAKENE